MRSDAYITVECDRCRQGSVEIELTAITRGGYDERGVDSRLRKEGWEILDGKDVCPGCLEDKDDITVRKLVEKLLEYPLEATVRTWTGDGDELVVISNGNGIDLGEIDLKVST